MLKDFIYLQNLKLHWNLLQDKIYLLREVGDPASDLKSYSNSVQEPLSVAQGNSG